MELFKGLKVIELASVLAGPAVGAFFAEMGSEVIKIENKKTSGDVTRKWKLPSEEPDSTSAYYASVNWGKQVKFLDFSLSADRQKLYDLIPEADIVVSNFKPSSAIKMGMDYATLKTINPGLIYAQLTGFGEDSSLPAFDVVLQAEAGFLYMCGEPEGRPVKMPVALIDILAAHQLKEGILLALMKRMQTGEGSYVYTSLLESALASLANQATNWLMAGHIPQPMGTGHPNIAPYGDIFYSSDEKPIVIAVGTDDQFRKLCNCLQLPHLAEDQRFKTNHLRVQNRLVLVEFLRPGFNRFPRESLMNAFNDLGVPAGRVRNMEEVFEIPAAREMILEEVKKDGTHCKSVKTIAFSIE
ncbi:MAG: CoA transferase [Bacteroidetes bacterium]|nr:MAG: CoA transferase [Bacteroidota bacterium]